MNFFSRPLRKISRDNLDLLAIFIVSFLSILSSGFIHVEGIIASECDGWYCPYQTACMPVATGLSVQIIEVYPDNRVKFCIQYSGKGLENWVGMGFGVQVYATGYEPLWDCGCSYNIVWGEPFACYECSGNCTKVLQTDGVSINFWTKTSQFDNIHNEICWCTTDSITIYIAPPDTSEQLPKREEFGPFSCEGDAGDPINVTNGNMYEEQRDAFFQTNRGLSLDFSRGYNSFGSSYGPLGYNWKHSFEYTVEINPVTKDVTLREPTGREITFVRFEWGSTVEYWPPYGIHYRLEYDTLADTCVLTKQDDTKYHFDSTHKLTYVEDRNGNQITLNYTGGVLQSVTDASGRELHLIYQGDEISQLQTGSGETLATYEYYEDMSTRKTLKRVTFSDSSWVEYTYDVGGSHEITQISNSDGVNRYFEYNDLGRVTANYGENGNQRIDLSYKTLCSTCPQSLRTLVVRNDNKDTTIYVSYWGPDRTRRFLAEVTNPTCGGCAVLYEYDGGGNISKMVYENGVEDSFAYDIRGNLIREVKAANSSIKQTTLYTYHPDFHLATRRETKSVISPDSSHVLTYQYDTKGNLLSVIDSGWVNPNGRYCDTTNYLYNDFGQLRKIDGPRSDVRDSTIFTYYANGDLDSTKQFVSGGTVLVVKNSLYDSLGNPQLITDPNGVKTRYFYDRKGRTTKIVNGSTLSDSTITQYTYNSYGNTKQITLPKGNTIKYNYDFANRLVSTVNGVNDSLKYSYDTENNRTREEVRSSSGVFTRYEDYRYDDRNRLEKIISSVNDTTIKDTTIFRYDQVGNRVFQKNAKGDSVTYRYDDLNRLTIVIQWKDGDSLKTSYSYDSGDNLRTVTDADSNVTSYKYSDKGLLTEDSSSVTGITRYYYNPAGNLTKKKDSQGDSILYSYDALNRLTLIKFQDTTKNIGYVYDTSSSYRMGRLYREVTPNDIITYSYKFTGLLSQEAKNISGVTYTTSYSYDKNGNMTSLTYPKGRVLSYFYDNADRVDSLRGVFNQTTTRYITSMNYAPYGGPTSFTYGNGITTTIKYNYRYLVDSLATNYNVTKRKYYFDKTGNITRIADLLYPAKSESLYYDPLSRLTLAVADSFPGDTIRYTYSDAGNRLTKIIGIDTTFYNYTDNKLASTTGNEPAVYRYDNKGNVIVDSTSSKDTLAYDQLNRLLSINEGAKGSYYYDGEGKRIRKNYSNSDVVYLYDQWGNVIAETDIYGNLMCDYIWANGRLVAKIYQDQFYPESFGEVGAESESPGPPPAFLEYVFYYHLDHLGTPLALTNVARSIQWSADYLPFGEIYNELIAPVSNEVRFPGQYHDRETDLYYNWHRYYKSTLGRYYQADPLIKNGQNGEFSYAKNDPSSFTDPLGLFSINDLFTRTDYCIDKPLPYPGDDSCIKTWTGKYKVNESLFRCIVWAESGHRTDSRKVRENPAQVQTEGVGALAQCKQDLKKDTPCFKGLNNRCDSFRCGAYYLSWCGRQFPADIQNNILCYRAGPWTVNNWQAVSEDNKALYQRYLKFVMSCFMMSGYKYQVLR